MQDNYISGLPFPCLPSPALTGKTVFFTLRSIHPSPSSLDSIPLQFLYIGGYCLVTVVPALLLVALLYYRSKRFRELLHPLLRLLALAYELCLVLAARGRARLCARGPAYSKVKTSE